MGWYHLSLVCLVITACILQQFSPAFESLYEGRILVVPLVFLCAAALGVAAYVKRTSIPGGIAPAIAKVIGLFLPFTIAISSQELEAGKVIQVGDTIPHFTAQDDQGATFDSTSLGGHLVLVKFFRAHW